MRYKRFEDLPVWNEAIELAVQIYALTSRMEFSSYRSLKDQIERAAVSVSNNIAEGFERGTTMSCWRSSILREVQLAKFDQCCALSNGSQRFSRLIA